MATDLERFVEADGREEQIAEVEARIARDDIRYLYCQFVSVTGRIMGKGIPAKHFGMIARKGFQLVYGSTANLFTDRHGNYIGYGPEARELVGIGEPETFMAPALGRRRRPGCGARCSGAARRRSTAALS